MTPTLALLLTLAGADYIEAPMVPGARALEEDGRYESPRNFTDTVEYYKRVFKSSGGVRWRNIVNLPGIKAKHLQNLRRKGRWDGINIYERAGKVRFFVIARPIKPPTSKK